MTMGSSRKPTFRQKAQDAVGLLSTEKVSRSAKFFQGWFANFWSRLSMLLFRRRSNFLLLLLIIVGALVTRVAVTTPQHFDRLYGSKSLRNTDFVERKPELLHVDISELLKRRQWSSSPITERMLNQEYLSEKVTGFVSNLDLSKLLTKKGKKSEKERQKIESKLNLNQYKDLATCPDLAYISQVYHSKDKILLEDDLKECRRKLLETPSFLWTAVKDEEDEKDMTENEVVQKRWFQFGTSAVWLESEQCYLAYSRVIYSTIGVRSQPRVSLVRGQAFDKNWKEIKGKRIPYVDVPIPDDMEESLKKIDHELGIRDCSGLPSDSSAHDTCVVENAKNRLVAQSRKERILSKYYMTYPAIVDIPFAPVGEWKGPEDPHVILRKANGYEEPVIVFNIWDDELSRRIMVTHMPQRKIDPLLKMSILGREQRGVEKNWTPFFHKNLGESSMSRGFIHFIYSFSPLEILKCSLNDGFCELVFGAETLRIKEENRFGGFRGGTQFVSLPDVLPQIKGQQIWVGFPKQHIEGCGCADAFYRPMFSILVEHDGVYSQELLVPALGFNIDVLSWDLTDTYCDEKNVISPNSIAQWDVIRQDTHTKQYEDYLTLTLSESDINTRVVTLKGMLNYILGMYKEKELQEKFEISDEADVIIGQTLKCLKDSAFDYCKVYGADHKKPEEEKEEEEEHHEEEEQHPEDKENKEKEDDQAAEGEDED